MIKLGGLVTLKPINEAEYTHIGYGKYKEKGKEKDPQAVTYQKDDNGKFTPISSHAAAAKGGDSSAGEDKPKVNIFNKDKKEKPKSKKGTSVFDVPGGLDVDDFGGKGALSKHVYGDDEKTDVVAKPEGKPDTSKFSLADEDWYTKGHATMQAIEDDNLTIGDLQDLFKAKGYGDVTDKTLADIVAKYNDDSYMRDNLKDSGITKAKFTKRIKDLSAQLKNAEPKSDTPKVKPRPANKVLAKTVDKFSKKLGLSPEKLGKEEYEKRMLSYVHDALEDANFHSANRQIFADLQGRPELAKRPEYGDAPKFGTPEREEWDEKNSIYNKAFDASVTEFDDSDEAVGALTSQAGWEGEKIIDALLDKLRKDGSGELADKIQISFDKDMAKNESSSKLGNLLPEEVLNEGPSTEEKRIAMLAVRKQAKFRSVSLEQAIQDQINALEDLMRDAKKGKLK